VVTSALAPQDLAGEWDSVNLSQGRHVDLSQIRGGPDGHGTVIADLIHLIRRAGVATVILAIPQPVSILQVMVPTILVSSSSSTSAV
jgi:hypothetical protein